MNTLSFSYQFDYEDDTVFSAHFVPYTFDDLLDYFYLLKKRKKPSTDKIMRLDVLCRTLAGNPCHLMTITNNVD